MHHGVCGMATIATSTPLLPHTHTTVTVIGGNAKQLLGSSTDWCATTIVTPHTRGATHPHMDGKVVWCGQCVVTVVCINTCMVTSLYHTICVCVTSSAKCVSPSIPPPLCFSITHTFFCVCMALSSGIHTLFVAVDALALVSVPLI